MDRKMRKWASTQFHILEGKDPLTGKPINVRHISSSSTSTASFRGFQLGQFSEQIFITKAFTAITHSKILQTTQPRFRATGLGYFQWKVLVFQNPFTFNIEAANSLIEHLQQREDISCF